MTAELQAALERGDPIVTMLWEPSWMAQRFDVEFLADPKGVFAPPQTYYWLGSDGFSEADPHLRELVASVYVPIDDVTAINAQMNGGMTVEEAVDAWWADHATLVERWGVAAGD